MESNSVSELFKLHPIDKKTLFWLMDNHPEEIESWIKFTAGQYKLSKKPAIDAEKLYKEVKLSCVKNHRSYSYNSKLNNGLFLYLV